MAAHNAKALDASRIGGETPLRSGTALNLFGKVIGSMLSGSVTGRTSISSGRGGTSIGSARLRFMWKNQRTAW